VELLPDAFSSVLYLHAKPCILLLSVVGLVLAAFGLAVRVSAMTTAKQNFTHQVSTKKRHHHLLITSGIYGLLRHTGYFGFFFWAIGTQILLANPLCILLYYYTCRHFFMSRIEFEESYCVDFFGEAYIRYAICTPTRIPGIKTSLDERIEKEQSEQIRKLCHLSESFENPSRIDTADTYNDDKSELENMFQT